MVITFCQHNGNSLKVLGKWRNS